MNPSAWLSTTDFLVEICPQATSLDWLPRVYAVKLRALYLGRTISKTNSDSGTRVLEAHSPSSFSSSSLNRSLCCCPRWVAGGAVDAGACLRSAKPADAEVCGLGGSAAWDPRSKASGAADFAPSLAPGFTPKFTHPGTTSYFPLDLTCCSQILGFKVLE